MPRTPSSTKNRTPSRPKSGGVVEARSSTTVASRPLPRMPMAVIGLAVLLGLWAAASTDTGRKASAYAFVIMDFFAGVIILVTLSLAVMVGVFATDRTVLQIRHRVMLQAFHRAMSVIAVSFLGIHIAVKVLGGRAGLLDAFIPFASPQFSIFVGFGTISAYLMMTAFWTGIARARFAGKGRPWMWRTLHCSAYASWPVALMHGLNAGRPGAAWVNISYVLCIGAVVIALLVRLYVTFGRRPSGVRTGPPTIGMNTQTVSIPRMREPVGVAAGVSAPPRMAGPTSGAPQMPGQASGPPRMAGPTSGPPGYPVQTSGYPAPIQTSGYPGPAQTSGYPAPAGGPWEQQRGPGPERWDGPPPGQWDGPPPGAGRWDERSVDYDPRGQEPERPRRWLRLVDDIPEVPPSEVSREDSPYGWAGAPQRGEREQQRGYYPDQYSDPGYQRPGPYPPALPAGVPAGRNGWDLVDDRAERRRRGRRVS